MLIYLDLLIALIGMLVYILAANPKAQELGREMFWVGLLAFLLCFCSQGGRMVSILPR